MDSMYYGILYSWSNIITQRIHYLLYLILYCIVYANRYSYLFSYLQNCFTINFLGGLKLQKME